MKRASIFAGVNVVLIIVGTVSTCKADLVYDNPPNASNGFEITSWIQASDFTLSQPIVLTDVRFWAFGSGYQGSVVWSIYANNTDQPGAPLYRAEVVPDRISYHPTVWGDSYQYDFSFGSLHLNPGTYWLGLHNGPLSFTGDGSTAFYWEAAEHNGTFSLYMDGSPFDDGEWWLETWEPAFQLFGSPAVVPVPGAVLLGALGLSVAGWRLKRKTV